MKINFRHADGTRSTVTLGDKLLDVWSLTIEDEPESMESILTNRIIPEAQKAQNRNGKTLVSNIEWLLLDEIAETLPKRA